MGLRKKLRLGRTGKGKYKIPVRQYRQMLQTAQTTGMATGRRRRVKRVALAMFNQINPSGLGQETSKLIAQSLPT
jgi:hypothetical protein